MTSPAAVAGFAPEFNDFLFAPIGEERAGMLLSVLSALARLNVDPWREAAELARMPTENASQRLSSLIAALPAGRSAWLEPAAISRLIAFLPSPAILSTASHAMLSRPVATPDPKTVMRIIVVNLVLMAGMLCIQWSLSGIRQTPAGSVHAPATEAVSPATPQPGRNQ